MNKLIRIEVYKILRKLGAERYEIFPEARLQGNLFFDAQDWSCFLFFIETRFNINITPLLEQSIRTIEDVILLVLHEKQPRFQTELLAS